MNSTYHSAAHKNYIHGIDESICRFMSELEQWEICEFIQITNSCHDADYKVDYLKLAFCRISEYLYMGRPQAAVLLVTLIVMQAYFLSVLVFLTAPNTVAIVKYLRLSQHNAATTAIVLVNGMPDCLQTFVFYENDTSLTINEMVGTGLYLWAFHGGIMMVLYPHVLYGVYYMRDAIAFFLGLIVLFNINSESNTSVFEGICALLFYPAYCFVVYVQHLGALEERKKAQTNAAARSKDRYNMIKEIDIVKYPTISEANPLNVNLWEQFLLVMNPFRDELYDNSAKWQRFLITTGFFAAIPIKLLIPIVDLKMPGDGWSRLLLTINISLSPLTFVLTFHIFTLLPYFLLSIPCGGAFFYFTKTGTPRFLFPLSLYGAVLVTIIIHELEAEVVALAVALGNIIGLKPPIIGFTLIGWANTFPEIVLYCTLVRWNYKTLAVLEFLMAPLFNMIFALALTTILKSIAHNSIDVVIRPGHIGVSGIWFAIIQHMMLTFAIVTTNFHLRRSVGIFSVITYFVFLFFISLYQFDGIHAYGTDHVDEQQFIAVKWA